MIRGLLSASAALIAGCSGGPSVTIRFPSQSAQDATTILKVETRDPTTVRAIGCTTVAIQVGEQGFDMGRDWEPIGPPFEGVVRDVPRGHQVIIALAVAETDAPFLAGCSDTYDSTGENGDPEVELS